MKDAAATAIYGARASDGVVLITTKSGQAGRTRYSLRSSYSFDDVNKAVPLQTEYGQGTGGVGITCPAPDCQPTSLTWGPKLDGSTPTYDHWGELFHTGHSFDNNLSISGGNERTTVYLSLGRLHQNGTIIGPNNWYTRNSARLKASYQLFDKVKVGGNVVATKASGHFPEHAEIVAAVRSALAR